MRFAEAGSVITLTTNGQMQVPHGTAGEPSYAFVNDSDCGFFRLTANTIALSTGGTARFYANTTKIIAALPINVVNGSVSEAGFGFSFDPDTGLFLAGLDSLGLTVGGVNAAIVTESGGNITWDFGGETLDDSVVKNYSVTTGVPDANSGNITFDYQDGPDFQVTLTGNVTGISFSNLPVTNLAKVSIEFIQDSSGGEHEVDFANSGINFGTANTPTMPISNGATMEIVASNNL